MKTPVGDDEFTCPLCGSRYFGTYGAGPGGLNGPVSGWVRYCKGLSIDELNWAAGKKSYKAGYTGCAYKWPADGVGDEDSIGAVVVSTGSATRTRSARWSCRRVGEVWSGTREDRMEQVEAAGSRVKKGRTNAVARFKVDSLDRGAMVRALREFYADIPNGGGGVEFDSWAERFLGRELSEGVDKEQLAVAMHVAFASDPTLNCIGPCSKCDGHSPDSFAACPFCGDADDGVGPVASVGASPVADAKPALVKKSKKKPAPTPAAEGVEVEPSSAASTSIVKAAPAVIEPPSELEAKVSVEMLDAAIGEINKLEGVGGMAAWRIGSKLIEIRDRGLYSLRLKEDGRTAHKTFEAFCLNELRKTAQYAYKLINIASRYDEQYVIDHGATKLALVFSVDERERPAVERMIEEGATRREVVAQVRATNAAIGADREISALDGKKYKAGARAGSAPAPREPKITVSAILGTHTVKLYKGATVSKKTDESAWSRAKRLVDEPVGMIELENGVVLTIKVVEGKDGHLEAKAVFRREES